jgi:formate dehydrogenase major subunit
VKSARGSIEATAIVTARFKPFMIDGNEVHQVGLPWHFGWASLKPQDSANFLTPHVGDGNTTIPEYKAFLVDIARV